MRSVFNNLVYVLALVILLSSCVGNRRIVLVQKDDVKKMHPPIDTAMRSYKAQLYDYRIQPMDILSIRFESLTPAEFDFFNTSRSGNSMSFIGNPGVAQLLGEVVNLNGEVTYPVIGAVKVAGLTMFEIQDKLQKLADEYLESPKVNVRLVNFRVTVMGEVNHESQVIMTNPRVNIIEAVALAGGFGELADRSRVKLLRQQGDQVTVQYLNLLDENLIQSPFYYMHQNDIIVVPPLKQRTFSKYFATNVALIISTASLVLITLNLLGNTR